MASFILRYSPVGGGGEGQRTENPDLAFCSDFTPPGEVCAGISLSRLLLRASAICLCSWLQLLRALLGGSQEIEEQRPGQAAPQHPASAGSPWRVRGPGHPGPGNRGSALAPSQLLLLFWVQGSQQGLTGLRTRHRMGATQQTRTPHSRRPSGRAAALTQSCSESRFHDWKYPWG